MLEFFALKAEVTEAGNIQLIQEDAGGDSIIVIAPEQVAALVEWLTIAEKMAYDQITKKAEEPEEAQDIF